MLPTRSLFCVSHSSFTHLSPTDAGKPSMVDITRKTPTMRTAIAEATLNNVPRKNLKYLDRARELILSGSTAAAVGTYKLIPFCHPLDPLQVTTELQATDSDLLITATVSTNGKTGVEMEALAAVSYAALTAMHLLKADGVSGVRLRHKSGGKSGSVNYDENGHPV
eukprot:TRINITY_DN3560_c3_g1_i2.p1 TRINITY_DN3560_c3_g1~~TRINITY_DN3560_c3_g1_i2.p1  ORF type:complete len:166 (+),score=42.41 TRINITY_DN3560_c3_g1_i2:59-556(+)